MPRNSDDLPRVLDQRDARKLLEDHGWAMEFGGSHMKMVKAGQRPITLPPTRRQTYSVSLTQRILKQAGLKGTGPEVDK